MAVQTSVINHLEYEYTEPVRDPLWKHIYLSRPLMKIIEQRPFLSLGKIKQLGVANLVYPGATHTRLSHSIGVFHLAKRIIRALSGFSGCSRLSIEGVKAFLSAALLHDAGHFPFTHSLKELPLRDHESLTAEIIMSSPVSDVLKDSVGVDPEMVAAIVDISMDARGNAETVFYRNLLSGVLDPDKLDYLNRDAYFCGVSYGIQDIDFVISRILPHPEKGIALEAGGLPAVENILFSKYLMYRTVYWHRTVRVATSMIKKAVFMGLRDGVITENDLYGLDDERFFSFFSALPYEPFRLIDMVYSRELLKTVVECPFDPANHMHSRLLDLTYRAEVEQRITDRLAALCPRMNPHLVIIDIPEPISFEVNIPVLSDGRMLSFPETGTVFTRPVVEGFTRVLRKIRLMVPGSCVDLVDDFSDFFPWM